MSQSVEVVEHQLLGTDYLRSGNRRQQGAFRHLVAEFALLQRYGDDLRKRIRALKVGGMKTEPAFAHALGLDGDPYVALLDLDLDPDLP